MPLAIMLSKILASAIKKTTWLTTNFDKAAFQSIDLPQSYKNIQSASTFKNT